MSNLLPPNFINELKDQLKLSSVAENYVNWNKRKSNAQKDSYWAPCPFHNESSSSFHVDDKKGFFYCFGCNEKGDVFDLVQKVNKIDWKNAVDLLSIKAGMKVEWGNEMNDLIELKDFIVTHFDAEHFLELGVVTGWGNYIQDHDRLLRSLSWGDEDYSGHVMQMLTRMERENDGTIAKIDQYLQQKFPSELDSAKNISSFSTTVETLGYKFVKPKNDIIAVMMPFSSDFTPVYSAVKAACQTTSFPTVRADEVWNNSAVINDILELINHAKIVICDLTGRNENVFYELGIAHAWGKKVIPITQSENDVPFDLKHHRYLKYQNNGEGMQTLEAALIPRINSLLA